MLDAGRFRDRATLKRATVTNVRGVQKRAWDTTIASRVPVQVDTATSDKIERIFGIGLGADRIEGVQQHVVTVRSPLSVQLTDQWIWHSHRGDVTLEVTAVRDVGPFRECVACGCEERHR